MNRSQSISFVKTFLVLGAALVLALSVSVTTRAQSTTNGAINGTVEDPQGAVVPGALALGGRRRPGCRAGFGLWPPGPAVLPGHTGVDRAPRGRWRTGE